MKCYLAKNNQILLTYVNDVKEYRYLYHPITLNISPYEDGETMEYSLLQSMLEDYKDKLHEENNLRDRRFSVISVGVGVSALEQVPTRNENSSHLSGYIKLNSPFPGNILEALRHFWGTEAKVKAVFNVVDLRNDSKCTISTNEMIIQKGNMFDCGCGDYTIQFPAPQFRNMDKRTLLLSANVTITLSIPNEMFRNATKSINTCMCQKILEEEILSDVTIVTGNGTRIKAHKNFLAAKSVVFLEMFQSNMSGPSENIVKISNISEEGIRVFLKYLYCGDTDFNTDNCQLLLELFHVANKYKVSQLEQLVKKIIMGKPTECYKADDAMRMFLFARSMKPEDEELKILAVKCLKQNRTHLKDKVIRELLRNDNKAALELLKYALAL